MEIWEGCVVKAHTVRQDQATLQMRESETTVTVLIKEGETHSIYT